jgi:endonuclease/exonuclease/phosphatase family metal-dependent hydrolase
MKICLCLVVLTLSQFVFAESITLMTFNIRYGTANDGENSWEFRKEHVVETIKREQPSVIALQEALHGQLAYIRELLPLFKKIGVHRSGNTEGEFSGLLIDSSKLEILTEGQIWLSEKPDEVSKGWDAALARTATWVTVREVGTSGPSMLLWSTHFDHRGKQARLESAKLIVAKTKEINEGKMPIAIMGDFNFTPESDPYIVFKDAGYVPAVPVSGAGTFHAFKGNIDGPRIDYIFLNSKWNIRMFGWVGLEDNDYRLLNKSK